MAPRHHREPHAHHDTAEHERAILDLLRSDGSRITTGRRAIVRTLLTGTDHHVTAEDLAEHVQTEHPDVHLSTVYRTLDLLEAHGIVARLSLGTGRATYHLTDHVHHHLVCDTCGDVFEIPASLLAPLARSIDNQYGFDITAHSTALTGQCQRCRAATAH